MIHFKMLFFFAGHGLIVEKNHENISFKQTKWLEKYISYFTQKQNRVWNGFEKDF